jgi:uncharacterized protein YbcI
VEERVSEAVARLYLDNFGKGPLHSETSIRDRVVLTVMREVLTGAERELHARGRGDAVLTARMLWQHATDRLFKDAIGAVLGREVTVVISGFDLDSDMASGTFVLAPDA